MKFLGVRFENFACFDECYLPMDGGVRILVGKNNIGKTALLWGLTLLNSIPVEPGTVGLEGQIARYVRSSSAYFDLHVFFEPKEEDYSRIPHTPGAWPAVSEAKKHRLDFHFRVMPQSNIVGLVSLTLLCDANAFTLLERRGNGIFQPAYNTQGKQLSGGDSIATAANRSAPDGSIWSFLRADGIFADVGKLRNVLFVDAHRVVAPNQPLQVVETLPRNAAPLAPFLDTLHGNDRQKFDEIEGFLTRVFPEFRYVNPEKRQNSVSLTLTKRDRDERIPLSHCGTGVEQVLAMATFVLTASPGSTILLDEPHSYLHPTAEHDVISFLLKHNEHNYFVSTHSAILINAVPADRVISVTPPRMMLGDYAASVEIASILRSLGYKNSDLLFSDRLLFVEGESDQEILPILLSRNPQFAGRDIDRTGFPTMGGEGKLRGSVKQRSVINFEKLLEQLGKAAVPRLYLFDGDCELDDARLIRETPYLAERQNLSLRFLRQREIENYLLVPEAILGAFQRLGAMEGKQDQSLDIATIRKDIDDILKADDAKLYPNGKTGDLARDMKGSVALERLFKEYDISYNKRTTGRLIAEHITVENQRGLSEIWDLVKDVFPPPPVKPRFA